MKKNRRRESLTIEIDEEPGQPNCSTDAKGLENS
jgi:hypothetical protein